MKDLNHLPVVDNQLAIQLADDKKHIATDMLNLLIKTLPDEISSIKQLYFSKKYHELQKQLHRLHGALCYCGTPRLKNVVAHLESNIKNNIIDNLPSLLDQFYFEVNLLLEYHSHHAPMQK